MRSIKEWQQACHKASREKGWYDGHTSFGEYRQRNILEMLCLAHTEISEAAEEYRDGRTDGVYLRVVQPPPPVPPGPSHISLKECGGLETLKRNPKMKPEGFAIELADLAIRLFDLAEYCGVDLEKMIEVKMAYNDGRPYRHGGKKA